jgi:hypothetical protein
MMLVLALVALLASIVVVGFLIAWHPTRYHPPAPEVTVDPSGVLDWCEVCGAPASHELAGEITAHAGYGHSAMVATYCAEHAPEGAVQVRRFASR